MGMITKDDVVLALSNSGSTAEIVTLLPLIKRLGITLISMTGKSPLAKAAEVNLDASVGQEACPLNLAPTSSTTVTLVLGDALAIALLETRGFTAEDFALSHPGGALGRRLLLKVEDVMHVGEGLPQVLLGTSLTGALMEMTRKGLGMTVVLDEHGKLAGIFTDGDLRRALDRGIDVRQVTIDQVMTVHGKTVRAEILAAEAPEDHGRQQDRRTGGGRRGRPSGRRPEHARPVARRSDVMSDTHSAAELPVRAAGYAWRSSTSTAC